MLAWLWAKTFSLVNDLDETIASLRALVESPIETIRDLQDEVMFYCENWCGGHRRYSGPCTTGGLLVSIIPRNRR